MKTVLVTGGAGYIGSHFVHALESLKTHTIILLDNLSTGHRAAVPEGITFLNVDLADEQALNQVFQDNPVDLVVHFAASIEAEESMNDPIKYLTNNTTNTLKLLEVMRRHNCKNIIFSSTAAVYGEPKTVPLTEKHPCNPKNYYGLSKRMAETLIQDHARKHDLHYVIFRYFNAGGANTNGRIGQDYQPVTHLIGVLLEVVSGKRNNITINGTNYDTPDGTCIRDYVHVEDLAQAHLKAIKHLEQAGGNRVYNVGSEQGSSVQEVISTVRNITNHNIPLTKGPRREGDPSSVIASSALIKKELDWQPKHDLKSIVRTAWNWQTTHPEGYKD